MGVKTSLSIDEKVWQDFRKMALGRYGSTKRLSSIVEEALRTYDTRSLMEELGKKLGLTISTYPSSKELKEARPSVKVSAGDIVREMRDERQLPRPSGRGL